MRAVASVSSFATLAFASPPYEDLYEKFLVEHSKAYANDNGNERQKRFEIFKDNVDIIYDHNSKGSSYTLAVNKFADLKLGEFSQMYLGYVQPKRSSKAAANFTITGIDIADSLDWVAQGAVTPVKNQMQCGSCWAFSTTGSVEGALKIAAHQFVSLSEQDLVSCDTGGQDEGCQGGGMDSAFAWIKENGICSEADYPYTSGAGDTGICKKTCTPEVTVGGFVDVPQGDESALLQAVTLGPVSVAIEADKSAFQLYSGGVLDDAGCGTELDHGVLIVGYGTDSGKDYWKVKNSWGDNWGEDGYLRVVRNKDMCGIADMASYPTGVKFLGPPPPPPAPTPAPPPPPPPGPPPSPSTGCEFPEVQACYTASLQTCWTPLQEKNRASAAALNALSDQTVATGIAKILIGGSEWKDVWSVQTVGEYAYLVAYKFQTYDFLEQYQFAQATLQLSGSTDPNALDAFNKITDQFDGTFFNKHGCGVDNSAMAAAIVV